VSADPEIDRATSLRTGGIGKGTAPGSARQHRRLSAVSLYLVTMVCGARFGWNSNKNATADECR
jgi:hypothetical protein